MKGTRIRGFNPKSWGKQTLDSIIKEQSKLLVEYAEKRVQEIGRKIASYPMGNFMDDTGNLLDSLCWGVLYGNEIIASGFYREQRASRPSYLHERGPFVTFDTLQDPRTGRRVSAANRRDPIKEAKRERDWQTMDAMEKVEGRKLALDYIAKAAGRGKAGKWEVFFAILAPYWGYWEKGFTMKGQYSETFQQFQVMTIFYDEIKADLKPAKTTLSVSVPKYASMSLKRQAKKNL